MKYQENQDILLYEWDGSKCLVMYSNKALFKVELSTLILLEMNSLGHYATLLITNPKYILNI